MEGIANSAVDILKAGAYDPETKSFLSKATMAPSLSGGFQIVASSGKEKRFYALRDGRFFQTATQVEGQKIIPGVQEIGFSEDQMATNLKKGL